MSQISLMIKSICEDLGVKYTTISDNQELVRIKGKNADRFILNTNLGLDYGVISQITKDKDYCYQLLNGSVNCPKTVAVYDYAPEKESTKFVRERSIDEMLTTVQKQLKYPVIVKRNSGTQGNQVYYCESKAKVESALKKIFDHQNKDYDKMAIISEFVKPKHEYRVILLKGKVELVYLKDNSQSKLVSNLSPLHQIGSKAVLITDLNIVNKLQELSNKIYNKLPIKYAGLDVIEDEIGNLWLIEVNSSPGYKYFLENNRQELVKEILTKIVVELVEN